MPANTPENRLKQQLKAANIPGLRLFSNPRGQAKQGGRYISFGLAPGSKDLASGDFIGLVDVKITEEMVGKTLPVFASIETKGMAAATAAQRRWMDLIDRLGGFAVIIYSLEQLEADLSIYRKFPGRTELE